MFKHIFRENILSNSYLQLTNAPLPPARTEGPVLLSSTKGTSVPVNKSTSATIAAPVRASFVFCENLTHSQNGHQLTERILGILSLDLGPIVKPIS